jgi:hypothetical protein
LAYELQLVRLSGRKEAVRTIWSLGRASDPESGAFTKPLGRAPLLAPSVLPYVTDYFGFVLKDET